MTHDITRALAAAGGSAALVDAIQKRARARDWIEQNRTKLLETYPEHWIAVYESEVIEADLTLDNLSKALMTLKDRYPISAVVIQKMSVVPQVNFY